MNKETAALAASIRTFGLCILCAVATFAASDAPQAIGEFKFDATRRVPNWSNGGFVSVGKSLLPFIVIYVSDANGHDSKTFVLPVPGADKVAVIDYTLASDGTVAVCGNAINSAGRWTNFIAFTDPNGNPAGITSTGTFTPQRIVFADGGTVWAAGAVNKDPDPGNVFRHFDRSGRLMGGLIPQTTLSSSLEMSNTNTFLTSNSGRVAWINRETYQYFEFTEDGRLLRTVSGAKPGNGGQRLTGIALQRDGTLVLSTIPNPQTTPRTTCLFSLAQRDANFAQVRCSAGIVVMSGARGADVIGRDGKSLMQFPELR